MKQTDRINGLEKRIEELRKKLMVLRYTLIILKRQAAYESKIQEIKKSLTSKLK